MNVAILGASNKPERYSFKALQSLKRHGHAALPVHPALETIDGTPVFRDLSALPEGIDTLTMYVGPEISNKLSEKIVRLNPRRVIFNPGSENHGLEKELTSKGILVVEACTLVLLATNQFEDQIPREDP